MNPNVLRPLAEQELRRHADLRRQGDRDAAWRSLELAHILSQPTLGPHVRVHLAMLGYAVNLRDPREIAGQLVRLALAPIGALTGRIPWGYTGRADVSAFQPMQIPDDLRRYFDER